jgi:hypothetical protein
VDELHVLLVSYSSKLDEHNKQVHGTGKRDYSELVEGLVSIKQGT